ncbi:MAG TPA: hypothetical protein VGG33_25115 [Polyangia bacterium]
MRIKVVTLVLAGAVLTSIVLLSTTIFRSDRSGSDVPDAEPPQELVRSKPRFRPRSIPQFERVEPGTPATVAAPAPPPPEPEALSPPPLPPPPQPTAEAELKARASRDGYAFREAGSQAVYVVQNGTKFHVQNVGELRALGISDDRIEVVPPGSLSFLRDRPPEKTLLRERDSAAVFYYENGQKRYIANEKIFESLGHKWSDVKVVPKGGLQSEANGPPIQ